ncbi:MAG: glycosyltransferase family 9 protein [Muribaculaceae bacterium]|nr:glycosyltransferase family 9 protein [Muribaculaceae bacterium]
MAASETPAGPTVLVIRFSALGDVAMTVPPVMDAALASPDTRFVMLTRPLPSRTFGPADLLPPNLSMLTPDLKRYKGIGGLWRLARELRRTVRPDIVVDLHDVLRSRIISLFLRLMGGVRVVRIDKGRREKRAVTRRRNKRTEPLMSGDARYRDTFRRAGLPTPILFRGFFSDERQERRATADTAARIAIAPFAAHPGKEWPLACVEKVIEHFSTRPGVEILVFGAGAREKEVIACWAARWPGTVTDMASKGLPLQEEMREMARCDVMLSMDSANMHLASLVGLPVVSVWGATDTRTGFLGWRQDPSDALGLAMECRPCSVFGNKPCRISPDGTRPCLAGLPPTRVISALESHLPLNTFH